MDAGKRELVFVLILMAGIMIFCVIAVIVFIKVWLKEHRTDKNS